MGKRGNGEGSIYRTTDGKWRATVSLQLDGGRRKRLARTCRSKADAVAALEMLRLQSKEAAVVRTTLSVSTWLHQWVENNRKRWAPNTTYQREYAIRNWIGSRIGSFLLADLNSQQLNSLLRECEAAGASTRILQLVRSTLFTACNAAMKEDLLATNPVARVPAPTSDAEAINPFTEEEVRTILKRTSGTRDHALYVLAFTTGLRISELLGLKRRHLDLEQRTIRIEEQLVDLAGKLERRKLKTKSSRRLIELSDAAVSALIAHQAIMLKEGHAASEMLFPSPRGLPQRRTTFVKRSWSKTLANLGLTHRGVHHTRHTFATLALRRGVPLTVVSAVLGHAKPEITLRTYSHFLRGDQRMSVSAMDSIVAGGYSVAFSATQKSS